MNKPFYHDWCYKTNQVIKFFLRQADEFIRVKTFLILNLRNEKVIFIVFSCQKYK